MSKRGKSKQRERESTARPALSMINQHNKETKARRKKKQRKTAGPVLSWGLSTWGAAAGSALASAALSWEVPTKRKREGKKAYCTPRPLPPSKKGSQDRRAMQVSKNHSEETRRSKSRKKRKKKKRGTS